MPPSLEAFPGFSGDFPGYNENSQRCRPFAITVAVTHEEKTVARKEITRYFDDLDGQALDDDQVVVVRFGYKGRNYVMDLSADNAAKIDEVLREYVAKATLEDGAAAPKRRAGAARTDNATRTRNRIIRQWAKDNGFEVADRGALPKDIIDKYDAVH